MIAIKRCVVVAVLCLMMLLLSACNSSAIQIEGVEGYQTEVVLRYLSYFDIEEIISIERAETAEALEFESGFEQSSDQEYTTYDVLDMKGNFLMMLNEYNDVVLIVDMDSGRIKYNMVIDEYGNPRLIEYDDLVDNKLIIS